MILVATITVIIRTSHIKRYGSKYIPKKKKDVKKKGKKNHIKLSSEICGISGCKYSAWKFHF